MYNGIDPTTDGITAGVEDRKQRGLQIAALARIDRDGEAYLVPSVTSPRPTKYRVTMDGLFPKCTCPDFENRGCQCKHIYAVQYFIERESSVTVEPDGSTTVTDKVIITREKRTYKQQWPEYNAAQVNEKRHFYHLLADLCRTIPTPAEPPRRGRGRPALPLPDAVFCAVSKVYSTHSARRFVSDLCDCQSKGYISRVPHYNSVFNYLEDVNMFPILTGLIELAATPLAAIEERFAVDSTGFAASRFVRWFDIKYNRFTGEQQWVKAHLCIGTKTNVVTAITIEGKDTGDSTQLAPLVQSTSQRFTMKEVSADKAYSGQPAHDAIAAAGATPYIMFKANATGGIGGLYAKMFHFFNYKRDEFLAHYHSRSNAESTVMMIKTKFGDSLRSKTEGASKNETLAKVLCHNICCVISAIYELGIAPEFGLPNNSEGCLINAGQNVAGAIN
jgi:transposase